MITNIKNKAFFAKYPHKIEDLCSPHLIESKKIFVVEKIIELTNMEYENFITDLCVERHFIEKNASLCYIDDNDVWHCLLVKEIYRDYGVLVQSDKCIFPKYAAYYEKKT